MVVVTENWVSGMGFSFFIGLCALGLVSFAFFGATEVQTQAKRLGFSRSGWHIWSKEGSDFSLTIRSLHGQLILMPNEPYQWGFRLQSIVNQEESPNALEHGDSNLLQVTDYFGDPIVLACFDCDSRHTLLRMKRIDIQPSSISFQAPNLTLAAAEQFATNLHRALNGQTPISELAAKLVATDSMEPFVHFIASQLKTIEITPEAERILMDHLPTCSAFTAILIAKTLGRQTVAHLVKKLHSSSGTDTELLIHFLGKIGGDQALQALRDKMQQPEYEYEAATALANMGDRESIAPIRQIYERQPTVAHHKKAMMVEAWSRVPDPAFEKLWCDLLLSSTQDLEVRHAVTRGMTISGTRECLEALHRSLAGADKALRRAVNNAQQAIKNRDPGHRQGWLSPAVSATDRGALSPENPPSIGD